MGAGQVPVEQVTRASERAWYMSGDEGNTERPTEEGTGSGTYLHARYLIL